MQQLLDFLPLIFFFVAYKLFDIYVATAVLIGATGLHYGYLWLRHRRLEKSHWATLAAVLLFGGLTLALRDETVLKWKAPLVNWLFALVFLASQLLTDRSLIERAMGHAIELPKTVWNRLNLAWVALFVVTGTANLYVAFWHPSIWVDFKVFGSLGLTLIFLVGQTLYLLRYIRRTEPKSATEAPSEAP